MSFIYDNLVVIYVALVASLVAWLYGGINAPVLQAVAPWLIFFMTYALIVFPQKHFGETTYETREHVWKALKKDPLVWTAIGFLILLAIPFANNGLCVSCDRLLIAQGLSPDPPVKMLPFCVNRLEHLNVFLWFAVALSAMIVTKHCLVRSGKRLLLHLIVWNGFILALLGFVQIAADAPGPLWATCDLNYRVSFFSTFGYPNMAGDYFTTLFGLSIALWRDVNLELDCKAQENRTSTEKKKHKLFWKRHICLLPAGVFFFAAISTLSRAAILLVSVMLVICFAHSLISITHKMHRKDRVKKGTIAVAVVGLIAFFSIVSMPEDVQREIDTLNTSEVLTRVTGKGQYHNRVATQVWRDNFLFGCGGWGYKHFCIPKMTPEELKDIQKIGGVNVHNDYLQFLAEHGIVGFGALVAMVVMLLTPVLRTWRKLIKTAQFLEAKKAPAKPVQIFALPAPVFLILATTVATFVHGFGDCIFRSPAVLTLFFISLAALPGFLPKDTDHAAR